MPDSLAVWPCPSPRDVESAPGPNALEPGLRARRRGPAALGTGLGEPLSLLVDGDQPSGERQDQSSTGDAEDAAVQPDHRVCGADRVRVECRSRSSSVAFTVRAAAPVITTSRRTYYLALVSPAKPATHAPRVKFYCPQDLFQQANGVFRATATERKRDPEATVVRFLLVAVDALNFNSRSAYVSWRPVRVFDDGTHVDIQMPEAMRVAETLARLVQTRTGDTALVSSRLRQHYVVTSAGPDARWSG